MEQTYEPTIFGDEMTVTYAGFWERFGALFLDGLVLLPFTLINYYNGTTWKSVAIAVVVSVAALVYKPLLEYLYGASLGKKGLTLTVVNRSYGKINGKEAVLRNIFQIVTGLAAIPISIYTLQHGGGTNRMSAANGFGAFDTATVMSIFYSLGLFMLYLADAICLAANAKKQSLHDLIAGTYVIKKVA